MKRPTAHYITIAAIVVTALMVLLIAQPSFIFRGEDRVWTAMQSRGTWRVGVDPSFPPFEMLDGTGAPIGYDIDLAHHIAAEWNLEVELVPIGFDSLLDAVQTDRIDSIVSALPFDPRLTKDVAYSPPYFEAGVRVAVRTNSPFADLAIQEADEFAQHLSGLRIAVEWGGQGDGLGRRLQRGDETIELLPFETPQDAVAALRDDATIDALFIDNITLLQAQGKGAPVVAVGPALEGNPYVIASPLAAHELQVQISTALTKLSANGLLIELQKKWFN